MKLPDIEDFAAMIAYHRRLRQKRQRTLFSLRRGGKVKTQARREWRIASLSRWLQQLESRHPWLA